MMKISFQNKSNLISYIVKGESLLALSLQIIASNSEKSTKNQHFDGLIFRFGLENHQMLIYNIHITIYKEVLGCLSAPISKNGDTNCG